MHRKWVQRSCWLALSFLTLAACSDGTGPSTTQQLSRQPVASKASAKAFKAEIVKRAAPLEEDEVVSLTVTPSGAWAYLPRSGTIIWFPEGAVSSDLKVTLIANQGSNVVFTFEPHGAQFNQPVHVAQLLRLTRAHGLRSRNSVMFGGYMAGGLADIRADGTGEFAEIMHAFFSGEGNDVFSVFTTTHFSGYALASGRVQEVVDKVDPLVGQ